MAGHEEWVAYVYESPRKVSLYVNHYPQHSDKAVRKVKKEVSTIGANDVGGPLKWAEAELREAGYEVRDEWSQARRSTRASVRPIGYTPMPTGPWDDPNRRSRNVLH